MKVLIVGLGSIALKHILALRDIIQQEVQFFALRSQSSHQSNNVDGVTNIYAISEIDMDSIDFVIISNPTSLHYQAIKQVVNFRKPLFIEKPLFSAITSETSLLIETIEQMEVQTYVACNLRFLDALCAVKDLVADERVNEVNVYCGSYLPDWRPGADFRKVYSANKELGGGVHIDLIHELDYVFWLWKEPKQRSAFFSTASSLDISAFDYANYLWVYEDFSVSIVLNYYRRDPKRTLEIVTEQATYVVDLLHNTIKKNGELIFSSPQRMKDTYKAQMAYFIDGIKESKIMFNSVSEANRILELCMQD